MKIILAVSGGIDSMVMLDMIYRASVYSSGDIKNLPNHPDHPNSPVPSNLPGYSNRLGHPSLSSPSISPQDLIVAHFDHGIRENSAEDAAFVKKIAESHNLRFVLGSANLGTSSSEAEARKARYDFLLSLAKKENGIIFTAHHLDDLVESIAINLIRGTGWRGVTALCGDYPIPVKRIFLDPEPTLRLFPSPPTKSDLFRYAAKQGLHFREDPTNSSDTYLRNRLRQRLRSYPLESKLHLYDVWLRQRTLRSDIDSTIQALLPSPESSWDRNWFKGLDQSSAIELLRAGAIRAGIEATRPQLEDFRQAVQNFAPGKYFNLPGDNLIKISKTDFTL